MAAACPNTWPRPPTHKLLMAEKINNRSVCALRRNFPLIRRPRERINRSCFRVSPRPYDSLLILAPRTLIARTKINSATRFCRNVLLYQLSYRPASGPSGIRTRDQCSFDGIRAVKRLATTKLEKRDSDALPTELLRPFGARGRIRTGDQRIKCSSSRIRRENQTVTTKIDETCCRALPLSYGPVCWSRRESNPRPRPF